MKQFKSSLPRDSFPLFWLLSTIADQPKHQNKKLYFAYGCGPYKTALNWGLVTKDFDGYHLTEKGKAYLMAFNDKIKEATLVPKNSMAV